MLYEEERKWNIKKTREFAIRVKERIVTKPLLPDFADILKNSIKNDKNLVIFEDERKDSSSTHFIFLDYGNQLLCIPIKFTNGKILLITLYDARSNSLNENWFVKKYNKIAKELGIPNIPITYNKFKPDNFKYPNNN